MYGYDINNPPGAPGAQLEILEQPARFYRMRYASELKGFHGSLKSSGGAHPKVQLLNYEQEDDSEVFIRVSLFTVKYEPHVHSIAMKEANGTWECRRYVDISVSPENNYEAVLKDLIIIRVPKSGMKPSEVELSPQHSQVRLGFFAFKRYDSDIQLCEPVYSSVIYNQVLKITRMSAYSGKEGDEVILLVSKITKSNVKVRFFEGDENHPEWETHAQKIDHHHQVAIVIVVPKFRDEISRKLSVQLERTEIDGSTSRSEARDFMYLPKLPVGRRRLSSPSNGSIVNPKILRPLGESASEGSIQVRNEYQGLSAVSSPNVMWANPRDFVESLPTELNSNPTSFILGPDVDSESQAGLSCVERMEVIHPEPNNQLNAGDDFNPFDLDFLIDLPKANWTTDLAHSTKKKGEVRQYADIDGIDSSSSCEIKSLEPNKDKSCATVSLQDDVARIFQAVTTGNAKMLEELLKSKTKIEQQKLIHEINSLEQQTPIIIAVEENHPDCIRLLCLAGANVNLVDEDLNSPFHIAAKQNHEKCLEMLLQVNEGKELDNKNAKGETALHLAVLYNSMKCMKLLLEAGANVNERNATAGATPLHLAVQLERTELVRLLLKQEKINIYKLNYEDKRADEFVKAYQEDIISLFKELQDFTVTLGEETTDEDE